MQLEEVEVPEEKRPEELFLIEVALKNWQMDFEDEEKADPLH